MSHKPLCVLVRQSKLQPNLNKIFAVIEQNISKNETRELIRGGEYSYLLVLPDKFLLKSVVIRVDLIKIRRAEHEYMKYTPPPLTHYILSPLNISFKSTAIRSCFPQEKFEKSIVA